MHAFAMDSETDNLLQLVAKNVATLVPAVFGEGSGKGIPQLTKASELPRSTIGRVVTPDGHAWSITTLTGLANALKVQPWQLLLPDLKVSKKGAVVSIEGMRARQWPFPTLRREEIDDLTATELERLEKTIRYRIDELKTDRGPVEVQAKRTTR